MKSNLESKCATLLTALMSPRLEARDSAFRDLEDWIEQGLDSYERPFARGMARLATLDASEVIRSLAATLLGQIGTTSDFRCLKLLLKDHSEVVRASAVYSCGQVSGAASYPNALRVLRSEASKVVRTYAAMSLGYCLSRVTKEDIGELFESESASSTRVALALILFLKGDAEAIDQILNEPDSLKLECASIILDAIEYGLGDEPLSSDQQQSFRKWLDIAAGSAELMPDRKRALDLLEQLK